MAEIRTPRVVAGGKIGEMAHCERCGQGLEIGGPQPLPIAVAVMDAFVKMHQHCKEGDFKEPDTKSPQDWLRGRDTGISSCTIYAVMMNTQTPKSCYDIPHDPDDFGRCYRLLKLFPAWRERMPEVSQRFPAWIPFVREWDKLTEMYERELETRDKTFPMYRFMQELRKEVQ